jgi:hypothetical protein
MNKLLLSVIVILSGCVEMQQPSRPNQSPFDPFPHQTSFHPTLSCGGGGQCGVSKTVYTITPIK